jgi:hypothetical protein
VHSHDISVVYALDISHSVSPEFVRSALDWMRQANALYRPAQALCRVCRPGSTGDPPGRHPAVMLTQEEASAAGTNSGNPREPSTRARPTWSRHCAPRCSDSPPAMQSAWFSLPTATRPTGTLACAPASTG